MKPSRQPIDLSRITAALAAYESPAAAAEISSNRSDTHSDMALTDLLGDLLHLADALNLGLELDTAWGYYSDEAGRCRMCHLTPHEIREIDPSSHHCERPAANGTPFRVADQEDIRWKMT